MAVTRTFSIIKPDATRRNLTGAVTKMLEEAGLRVVASKRIWMSPSRPRASTASIASGRSSASWSSS
jgi:nucleoside diphosphate kinase